MGQPGGGGHAGNEEGHLGALKLLELVQKLCARLGNLVQLPVDEGVRAQRDSEVDQALV